MSRNYQNSIEFLLQENEVFAKVALVCVATLTLRSKDNSQAFFDVGMSETITDTMRLHPESKIVQVNHSHRTIFDYICSGEN